MPRSMSAASATPSPRAKQASLTSWATIRPPTSPGPSPTHSARRPSVAKKASSAAAAAGAVVGVRVSSTSPPSATGSGSAKPAAPPPGSWAESGAASHSSACGPPCSAGSSSPGPQSRIRNGTSPSASHGVRASQPAASAASSSQAADLRLARDDDQPVVPAAGRGRRRVRRAPRRVRVPALRRTCGPGARSPRAGRRAATGASAARSVCAWKEVAMATPTSMPTRSISSNGPMRKPQASRQMRSTCSGVARRSCTIRIASSPKGRLQRFTRKPGPSCACDDLLAHRLGDRAGAGERLGRRRGPGDELDEPHARHGVEEVQADDARGLRDGGGDRAHGERRRVAGEHRVLGHDAGQRAGTARA